MPNVLNGLVVWPGQAEMLNADTKTVALFTGAGFGKSDILCRRAFKDGCAQDFWWENQSNWRNNHLKMIMGAPHDRYLQMRLIPGFRGFLDEVEMMAGRKVRKRTGRYRDGWFGSRAERKQEMINHVDYHFYPLHSPDAAVATDAAGLYVDEATMLEHPETWLRSCMRIRDPRAKSLHIACVGTPEKDHFLYELLIDPETEEARPNVTVILDSSIRSPALKLEYFERVGSQASEAFKEMQVMGRWVRGASGQRFAHLFHEAVHIRPMQIGPHIPGLKFDIGWDPGYRVGCVLIAYYHPQGFWCIVDEIVIKDKTTHEVCDMLLELGYNKNNIRSINADPRDANKRKSTSRMTDRDVIWDKLRVRAKLKVPTGKQATLAYRLNSIQKLLSERKIFFNERMRPRTTQEICAINAIKRFATKKMRSDDENFSDVVTTETNEKWKHTIDALHYILLEYERQGSIVNPRNT